MLAPRWARLDVTTTRDPGVCASLGRSSAVSAKPPRWLTPSCSSKPCVVRISGGIITPALLMSASMRGAVIACPAAARTLARSARSSGRNARSAPGWVCRMCAIAASAFDRSRHASRTRAPRAASTRDVSRPRPVLAPVTMKPLPDWSGTSASVKPFRADMVMFDSVCERRGGAAGCIRGEASHGPWIQSPAWPAARDGVTAPRGVSG